MSTLPTYRKVFPCAVLSVCSRIPTVGISLLAIQKWVILSKCLFSLRYFCGRVLFFVQCRTKFTFFRWAASIQNSHCGNSGSSILSLAGLVDRSGDFFQSITAEFIYWIVDRHSGLPNVLSISMARCVLAQRIPTVGIWRYVVDVPGSVNRSGGSDRSI